MSQARLSPVDAIEQSVLVRMRQYLSAEDAEGLTELLDPLPFSDALREFLHLTPEERDSVLSMVPSELAAEPIEEAPNELAVDLVERLQAETAAEIIDELDSDVQADVIGDLVEEDAEAILAEMDAEVAAGVRRLGAINGAALGLLIGLVAWLWKGNPYLGLVVGLALALNTLIAVSIGGVVPLLLKRIGQDPAVASGPLLTTITDMAGFFLVLSLASAFMPLLA